MEKVMIFGASSELASTTAYELYQSHNCDVCLVSHKNKPKNLLSGIKLIEGCDITNWHDVNRAFKDCVNDYFVPTSVINCVGTSGQCSIDEMTYNEWRRVLGVNLDGAFNVCQNAITYMKASPEPKSLILIGSAYGVRHISGLVHYCTSKAAISGLVKSLSVEIAKYNFTINALVPSMFRSNMTELFYEDERYISAIKKHYPAGKLIDISAIVSAILLLINDKTMSINGSEIIIDGGYLNMIEGGMS